MSGIIKSFDYSLAVEHLRVQAGSMDRLSESLDIKATRLSSWKHGRSRPIGDEVLLLINEAYKELSGEQFGECLNDSA